jgi:hypothetical protein
MVPREVADVIKARRFLGYRTPDVNRN